MLQSENPQNGLKAIGAFFRLHHPKRSRRREFDYVYEHGQLWIVHKPSGATWSVVDTEGGDWSGFGFEVVDSGDGEALAESGACLQS